MALKYTWFNTIEDIKASEWNNIFKYKPILTKYEFSKAVERSELEDVYLHYLVVSDNNTIYAILPCFLYSVKLEILAGDGIKKVLNLIRKIFPKFLVKNLFVIGSPVATCENHIGLNPEIYKNGLTTEFPGEVLFKSITEKAYKLNASLIIVKELPHAELDVFRQIFNDKFKLFESLPNSFIPIFKERYPYPSILKKRYRQRYKKAIQEAGNGNYQWDLISQYSLLTKDIHRLYLNVYQKSKYKFEKLTLNFFEAVQKYLPDNSHILTCRDKAGDLICAELIIEDERAFIPMYLGLDYSKTEKSNIYYNVIFKSLLEAEKRNKEWIVLGQTSYEPKAYSGAYF